MLDYDYDAAMLKKKHLAWGEADFMPINSNPFYDTSYYINHITWMHYINVTLQLVSAQKDTYASQL